MCYGIRKRRSKYQLRIIICISGLITLGLVLLLSSLAKNLFVIFSTLPLLAIAYSIAIFGLPYPFVYSNTWVFSVMEVDNMTEDISNFLHSSCLVSLVGALTALYVANGIDLETLIKTSVSYFLLIFGGAVYLFIYHVDPEEED